MRLPQFSSRCLAVFVALGFGCAAATARDIYIAQSASGSNDGTSCGHAYPVTYLNVAANWGSGASQIGPGTTVHLCGTITTSLRTFGNGLAGQPITIVFESGAKLSQPVLPYYYGGLLISPNSSYITVDGGINGVIESTANGSGLPNHSISTGLSAPNCSNCEIKNLTIQNIFVHLSSDDAQYEQTQINAISFSGSGIHIHHNTIHDVAWALYDVFGATDSNVEIDHNEVYNMDHGIALGNESSNRTLTTVNIHDNHFHDMKNWDTASNRYHHDGVHVYACDVGGCTNTGVTGLNIYNNLFDGDDGNCCVTSHVYLEGTISTAAVFNNVSIAATGAYYNAGMLDIWADSLSAYNNTVLGSTTAAGYCVVFAATGSSSGFYNNAVAGCRGLIWIKNTTFGTGRLDNNVYANGGPTPLQWNSTTTAALSTWQFLSGGDASGQVVTNLGVSPTTAIPQATSALINAGKNLTALGIPALDRDIVGVERPTTAPYWDAGAYVHARTPTAPTGLTAIPH